MFAVLKTGGKQYRVAANDVITIEKHDVPVGETILFNTVLMLGDGETVEVGAPHIAGASIAGEVVEHNRAKKVIAFKKRRRQNSKRKRGHRQHHTIVRITEILTKGAKPSPDTKSVAAPLETKAAIPASGAQRDTSNLSLIAGIGPTIEKKLRAAGILNWETIARWNEDDLAKWDSELALRGRAKREEWVEQAKELLAGNPPRAKTDREELASGKDL
jgi:large subunit ribosomal protein L21